MTVSSSPNATRSAFQKELEVFGEQFKRLFNCTINNFFNLTVQGSQRRNQVLIILFVALGAFFIIRAHPISDWGTQIGNLFSYLFRPEYALENQNTPVIFVNFVLEAFRPEALRYLPILIVPFIIAQQSAAIYLADIFELEDVSVAREFIVQVALTGSRKSIRIGNGEVPEKEKNSPIYQIGGPGQVLVELDSAALFEKFDGRPNVIGPTVNGKATLEGFERFRQVIDLRDQYTDPDDPVNVNSRSLDGIQVGTKDVRFVYSVWRGDKERTAKFPHPYGSDKSIEDLVYRQSSKVVEAIPPSIPPEARSLFDAIIGVIRRELGGFMNKHRLADYLASIGMPEVEKARELENEIVEVGNQVVSESDPLHPREVPGPPDFQPRNVVSDLFDQFTEGFMSSSANPGVQLQWIGVGTWKMPTKITDEIITNKHLEAWRISTENVGRGNKKALKDLREESKLQQTLRLIQKIPLARFNDNANKNHRDIVRTLLLGYREQLIEIIELLVKSRRSVPPSILKAIQQIEKVLGINHWVKPVGSPSASEASEASFESAPKAADSKSDTGVPPAPDFSEEEITLYEHLMQITGHDWEHANRLIKDEYKKTPNASRAELIKRTIERWMKDNP